jgi:UDP-N-acetylmuramoylalanine--D-glutamate ligase
MTTTGHLDYHPDTEEYILAKLNLVKNQGKEGRIVANIDYPNSRRIGELSGKDYWEVSTHRGVKKGCYVKDEVIYWTDGKDVERIIDTKNIFIPGRHNWENVAAAVTAAKLMEIDNSSIVRSIELFKGLPHRIELVRDYNGIKFYDDSFSTNPDTAIAAIRAFSEPKILILGGSTKNSDFSGLGEEISSSDSVRAIIGIGQEWSRIKSTINYQLSNINLIEGCKNMPEIVEAAVNIAEAGDVVLLSPACASFDMFKNYKDRGEQFKTVVNALE